MSTIIQSRLEVSTPYYYYCDYDHAYDHYYYYYDYTSFTSGEPSQIISSISLEKIAKYYYYHYDYYCYD